ncbi:leucine-rich repeat domain-containing protein [Thalassoroseus pseudoceratinae]|uniref:hypothetical protein n=1 Tax=Thalassoroseus pseudoceratinae TaxID=2713176 RepID=UPI0014235043|nr:hypothetical protein [Thalassoroseus pseudoceratinae]
MIWNSVYLWLLLASLVAVDVVSCHVLASESYHDLEVIGTGRETNSMHLIGFGSPGHIVHRRLADFQLRHLSIESLSLTHDDCRRIATHHQLESIGLVNCGIRDNGIRELAELPNLRMLDLRGNPITDNSLKILVDHDELSEIDLRGTCVTLNGIQELQRRRPQMHIEFTPRQHCRETLAQQSSIVRESTEPRTNH